MLQPTPNIVSPTGQIEITFTPSSDATDYTIYYSFDGGTTYHDVLTSTSPKIIFYDELTDCGKTVTGYIVANCATPNPPVSAQIKFPDVVIPACPAIPPCSDNYQPMIAGLNPEPKVKKITTVGVYDNADISDPITIGNGVINYSTLGQTGFYIVGSFTTVNGTSKTGIAKLKCDNIIDPAFIISTGLTVKYSGAGTGIGYAVAYDSTLNRVYVGGDFSQYNGTARNNFVALDATTGVILSSPQFNIGLGFQSSSGTAQVNSIVIQPNGKILVGGAFETYAGQVVNRILRLNTNGSRDLNFNAKVFSGINPTSIADIALDTDDSIFVTGDFEKYDNANSNIIAKLTSTGLKDPIFDVDTNINNGNDTFDPHSYGHRLLIQDASTIILTGHFLSVEGLYTASYVRLLKTTGKSDPTYFRDATSAYGAYTSLKKAPDGKILMGGLSPRTFQGQLARSNYFILDPIDLKIDTLSTPVGTPFSAGVSDILIKYTP